MTEPEIQHEIVALTDAMIAGQITESERRLAFMYLLIFTDDLNPDQWAGIWLGTLNLQQRMA